MKKPAFIAHVAAAVLLLASQAVQAQTVPSGAVYAYPNPAASTSFVTFHAEIEKAVNAEFRVYDVTGELIHEGQVSGDPSMIQGTRAYEYRWNFGKLASGCYFLVVRAQTDAGSNVVVKKSFVVVK